MNSELFALRYDKTGNTILEAFYDCASIGVRWAMRGGVQRIELTVKAKNKDDAYNRYKLHIGFPFAICDSWHDRPIAQGRCYEVRIDGPFVTYIILGIWRRHQDVYEETAHASANSDAYLKTMLTAHVTDVSSNQGNIVSTGTSMGNYELDPLFGNRIDKIVDDIIKMGTSDNSPLAYYLVPDKFGAGGALNKPLPYLEKIGSFVFPDWSIPHNAIQDLNLSRDIYRMFNYIQTGYTLATSLTVAASSGATSLTVASITGFADNDQIRIQMDSGTFRTTTINGTPAGSTINIDDALTDAAAIGNLVAKVDLTATTQSTDLDSVNKYFTVVVRDSQRQLNLTQATQYQDALLGELSDTNTTASFSVKGAYIETGTGAKAPIWRMLIKPRYIAIPSLYVDPEYLTNPTLRNGETVFWVAGVDYDHNSRTARITPEAVGGERRIDVLLQQLGSDNGQIVQRA